jgi:hypothetical protein
VANNRVRTRFFLSFLTAIAAMATQAGSVPQTATSGQVLTRVVDSAGQVLIDLQPDDFLIDEDGVEREVLGVRVADYPVVVLVDDRAGGGSDLAALRQAVAVFVGRLGDRAVALGTLAHPPGLVTRFGDGRAAMLARLATLPPNPSALLRPLEAIAAAASHVREVAAPFTTIVVLTERSLAPVDPESLRLLNPVLDSRAVVHVIVRQPPGALTGSPSAPGPDGDVLRDLAQQTGGQYTPVFAVASYAAALERLAERMMSELIVEYLVPPGAPAARVRVGVRVPGARVQSLRIAR